MLVLHDQKRLVAAVHLALADTANEAAKANQQAIESNRYSWPRETVRSDGTVAGLTRDIVDTTDFLASQELDQISLGLFSLSWGGTLAPYAAAIFYGATLKSGAHLPARKWIYEALRGDRAAPQEWRNPDAILNVPEFFRERFKRYAKL